MFEKYPDVVGIEELCLMLGVGKNTAYKLINNKYINSLRIGRNIKIPKKYIIDFCLNNGNLILAYDNISS